MKIAIVVDSTAYLSDEILEKNNIYTIPLNTIFGDEVYREGIDISAKTFYEKMRTQKELPSTTQPSIGDYILLLEQLHKKGYTDVISFHLSKEISGTIQNAIAAGQSVEGINVHAIDSGIACTPLGLLAVYAAENKENMSLETLLERVKSLTSTEYVDAFFIVNDLENLKKGGRLSNAQAFVGGLLKIKPILQFQSGKIVAINKIRTMKKAQDQVEDLLQESIGNRNAKNEDIILTVIHANASDEADEWMEALKDKFPGAAVLKSYFGPVIGTHLGEKSIGVSCTSFDVDLEGF